MESINVVMDDNSKETTEEELNNLIRKAEEDSIDLEDSDPAEPAVPNSTLLQEKEPSTRISHNHLEENILGELDEDSIGKSIDPTLHRSMIGSLLYITPSRPDIAFSVGIYARFQRFESKFEWAGNADDRKSTTGGCFYVGSNLVAWMSKKQNYISLSTVEAEYIVAGSCCTQFLWMKKML
ncbi:uncharacterized mitochondrial protein AtMg00810-like [Juglans microcarpa x Juglans regia]|uniref:uncharacterized mitochondrial protein AtMg00810-like n=1 Tax=Juglans microcarpa x Juglans regia TaxID=2249226 RepID=UPI001B7F5E37|nr:uncharacterized mitochondrial protein AtMg00810-like [Juglans microcarpa x Juglans regia]